MDTIMPHDRGNTNSVDVKVMGEKMKPRRLGTQCTAVYAPVYKEKKPFSFAMCTISPSVPLDSIRSCVETANRHNYEYTDVNASKQEALFHEQKSLPPHPASFGRC